KRRSCRMDRIAAGVGPYIQARTAVAAVQRQPQGGAAPGHHRVVGITAAVVDLSYRMKGWGRRVPMGCEAFESDRIKGGKGYYVGGIAAGTSDSAYRAGQVRIDPVLAYGKCLATAINAGMGENRQVLQLAAHGKYIGMPIVLSIPGTVTMS